MTPIQRTILPAAALVFLTCALSEAALAACNATVNGRPMSPEECALTIEVYGQVVPGDYLVDQYGNWVNINNPMHRGNTYRDAQGAPGGSWGGGSYVSPHGVYDSSGGCEGGNCVNIID
jgi:hypothetical protein